jgi:ubiquinone/menaquinone biosynthesis C-methylase UbiE
MTLQRDPERSESKYLHRFANFSSARVLEVGCGEGRMTWQYAGATPMAIGVDPDMDSLRIARVDRSSDLEKKVHFSCAASEYLPFSKETFDIAILAWSL